MATNYTSKKVDGVFEIYRVDTHICTLNPVDETLNWVDDEFKKYQGHVAREVNAILAHDDGEAPVENPTFADTPPAPAEPTAPPVTHTTQVVTGDKSSDSVAELKRQITRLQVELAYLKDENLKLRNASAQKEFAPHHSFDPKDLEGSPPQDPNLGDLTPEVVEWAKKNLSEEKFNLRYRGRIKNK